MCRTRLNVERWGLSGEVVEGCIRDSAFLKNIHVPCTQSSSTQYTKDLQFVKNIHGATYSQVELGLRLGHHVFIKKPVILGKSLLYEACIQQVVKESLERGGFPKGAAKVYDVFKLVNGSTCFSMEIFDEAVPLSILIASKETSETLTVLILELLFQLCAMLWHLDTDLGMNHRDLKPSNIMVEEHAIRPLTLRIGTKNIYIQSRYTLSLVDFGFSCLGSTDTHISDIAIGGVYPAIDPCPKDGRDLYMFLAFLYMECKSHMGADLKVYFAKWLKNDSTGILGKIDAKGHDFSDWIYFITGSNRITKFECTPINVIQDLLDM